MTWKKFNSLWITPSKVENKSFLHVWWTDLEKLFYWNSRPTWMKQKLWSTHFKTNLLKNTWTRLKTLMTQFCWDLWVTIHFQALLRSSSTREAAANPTRNKTPVLSAQVLFKFWVRFTVKIKKISLLLNNLTKIDKCKARWRNFNRRCLTSTICKICSLSTVRASKRLQKCLIAVSLTQSTTKR